MCVCVDVCVHRCVCSFFCVRVCVCVGVCGEGPRNNIGKFGAPLLQVQWMQQ